MKIISPFSDYYDSCLKYFDQENQNIIYQRKLLEIKKKEIENSPFKEFYNKYRPLLLNNNYYDTIKFKNHYCNSIKNKHGEFSFYHALIFFCGKIYPVFEIHKQYFNPIDKLTVHEKKYFYMFEELNQYLNTNEIEFDSNKAKQLCQQFFIINNPDTEYLIKNKITIALIDCTGVFINQKLSNYDFYKVFSPYEAFQELDIWFCGTLAYPQNIMIEVSNNAKIIKHGFDFKYGFRKRK